MITRNANKIQLSFTQPMINWLNRRYPLVNWFLADGIVTHKADHLNVGLEYSGPINCQKYAIDFVYKPDIFFKHDLTPEEELDEVERLLRAFADWIMEIDEIEGTDVYLLYLEGELFLYNDQSYVEQYMDGVLRLVGTKWRVCGAL